MKYAIEEFPLGTFKDQKTAGAYMNGFLSSNLDLLARRIVDDLHFLGIISGNDAVGNGKSTMATHVGAYLTWKINELHNLNLAFTHRNMVFKSEDLEKRSFKLPPYSVIILDESDDLKQHHAKDSTQHIKRYFRKCRQLNQILIIITPSFFELPKFYALQRSHFLINVKFHDDFRRGIFDFYGHSKKKSLYLKGRKEWNYDCVKPDFAGAFSQSYVFFPEVQKEILAYRDGKYKDMQNHAEDEYKPREDIIRETRRRCFYDVYEEFRKRITIAELIKAFGVSIRTGDRWLAEVRALLEEEKNSENSLLSPARRNIMSNQQGEEIEQGEGGLN